MSRNEIIVSTEEMERQQTFAEMVRALPHRPKSYHVVTYGCQMNAHDSERSRACWNRWEWPPRRNGKRLTL